ncbi:MAG TPA: hemolysin family protein [Rectinemataceae bacterium]|nr:hemolysin family protein [Rectinemataceae bacterium]
MGLELAIILALVLLNGFFSLSEMAVVSSRKARLRHEAQLGKKAYRLALETAENPSRFLSTIQVVISLVGTSAGAYGGATVARSLEAALARIPLISASAAAISVAIVVIGTTFVSVVLGELVPKTLALARPEPIAAAVIGPLRVLAVIFAPLARFLSATTDLVVALLGAKGAQEPAVTEEEVRVLIAQGTESGVFETREREMVEGVLSLGDRRVTSLMTPRTEIVSVSLDEGVESIRGTLLENARYGYLPAVDETMDHIIGMLPVKESLAAIALGRFDDPRSFLRPPVLIPESISALKAVSALKEGEVKTAMILDEYGGVAGLVSLSDLMESIVGDLPLTGDEDEPEIVLRADGSYLVDGALPIDRFIEELELSEELGLGDYDTVAGLVLDRMGTIPRAGESCRWDGCSFEIMDMDGNRIDKILVTRLPPSEE